MNATLLIYSFEFSKKRYESKSFQTQHILVFNVCPQFMPLSLTLAKNAEELKYKQAKQILAGNEVRQHAPRGPRFLFLLGWVVVLDFCCSPHVLMKFLSGSQWVFNITLKFPMCSSTCSLQLLTLYHILCPELYPLTYVSNPKEEITTYLLWDCLNQCCVSLATIVTLDVLFALKSPMQTCFGSQLLVKKFTTTSNTLCPPFDIQRSKVEMVERHPFMASCTWSTNIFYTKKNITSFTKIL